MRSLNASHASAVVGLLVLLTLVFLREAHAQEPSAPPIWYVVPESDQPLCGACTGADGSGGAEACVVSLCGRDQISSSSL
jgi:hypothetical protein